ncbi:MAG TPA: hypothetical protein VN976_20130 [Verrucomicrobiae bacterium]|nr:hypothetical protein [Verrucomicrobiae bacterium]
MSFETGAHRTREVQSRSGIRASEPIFPGAGLMEASSLLIRRCKGNLRVRDGIVYLTNPALAGRLVW